MSGGDHSPAAAEEGVAFGEWARARDRRRGKRGEGGGEGGTEGAFGGEASDDGGAAALLPG